MQNFWFLLNCQIFWALIDADSKLVAGLGHGLKALSCCCFSFNHCCCGWLTYAPVIVVGWLLLACCRLCRKPFF